MITIAFYTVLTIAVFFTLYYVYANLLIDKRISDFQNELLKLKRGNYISSALYFTIISKLYNFNINITDKEYFTELPIMNYLDNNEISVKIIKEKIEDNVLGDDGLTPLINLLNFHVPESNIGYKGIKDKYIKSILNKENKKYRDIGEKTLHRVNAKTIDELIKVPRRMYNESNPRLFKEAKAKFMKDYKTKYSNEKVEAIKSKIPHDHYLRDNPEILVKDLIGPAESLVNEYITKDVLTSETYAVGGISMIINEINKQNVVTALTAMFLDSIGEVYIARMSYMLGMDLGFIHIQNKIVLPILEARIQREKDIEASRNKEENMSVYSNMKTVADKYIDSFKGLISTLIINGNLEEFIGGYNELLNITDMDVSGINYNILSEKQYIIPTYIISLFSVDYNYNTAVLKPNLNRDVHNAIKNISNMIGKVHTREGIIAVIAELCECTPTYIENVYTNSYVHMIVNKKKLNFKLVADGLDYENLTIINKFVNEGVVDSSVNGTKLGEVLNKAKNDKCEIVVDNGVLYAQSGVVSHASVSVDEINTPVTDNEDYHNGIKLVKSKTAEKNMEKNKDKLGLMKNILGETVAVDMTKRNDEHTYWNNASFTAEDIANGVDPTKMSIDELIKHRTETIGKASLFGSEFQNVVDSILNGNSKIDKSDLYSIKSKVINDEQSMIIDNAKRQYLYNQFEGGNK